MGAAHLPYMYVTLIANPNMHNTRRYMQAKVCVITGKIKRTLFLRFSDSLTLAMTIGVIIIIIAESLAGLHLFKVAPFAIQCE